MHQIIAFTNQKGGVGKTTTCVNLAGFLAASGKKVLLVDMDPQGNATTGSGVAKHQVAVSVNEVLCEEQAIEKAIVYAEHAGYDVLASNADLNQAKVTLVGQKDAHHRLKKALRAVQKTYDHILIDCPPSLNMLTLNALSAADGVVITVQCEYYALEGLSDLLVTLSQIQGSVNPQLGILGVLKTMVDKRSRLVQEVSAQIDVHFGKAVFKTEIPRNIRLAEAPSHGLPIVMYAPSSTGARAYASCAQEFKRRLRQPLTQLGHLVQEMEA